MSANFTLECVQDADWSVMMPHYSKTVRNKKKKSKKRVQKEYNPLPPAPIESKLDQKLAAGEYFISNKLKKKTFISKAEQKEKSIKIQQEKRSKQFAAPAEPVHIPTKKRKFGEVDGETKDVDVNNLKKKVKSQKNKLQTGIKIPPNIGPKMKAKKIKTVKK